MADHALSRVARPLRLSPAQGATVRRKCACGAHVSGGGPCANCQKKRVQAKLRVGDSDDVFEREADRMADHVMATPAPSSPMNTPRRTPVARDASAAPVGIGMGQALDASTRQLMEAHFGHDFSGIRVHTNDAAAASARELDAQAYTTGSDVVFGRGSYQPATWQGRHLIAHELTHVVQQSGGRDTSGAVRRKGVTFGGFFGNLFRFWDYSPDTLQAYLRVLDQTGDIEDDDDSDDKCRQIVRDWKRGGSPYVLTEKRKALMIREMQSGFTGDDDELAILELLERSYNFELSYIYGAGGVTVAGLDSDFHGEEWDRLKDFYNRRFEKGYEGALKGALKPIGLPVPYGQQMPMLGSWMTEDMPGAVTEWNVPCVLGILCSEDRQVVAQLPKTTVKITDAITEYYWEFDGKQWQAKTRERGAAHNAGRNETVLKKSHTCAEVASDLIHEVRHHNQPGGLSPTDVEVDAYTFEEQWLIDRGLPGRKSLERTNPQTQQQEPDKGKIEAYVKSRYSGAASGAPTERVVDHLPTGEAKVERPDGSTYTRPAVVNESHQDYPKTAAGMASLPKVDPKAWACPGKP